MDEERESVAAELARVRDEARERESAERAAAGPSAEGSSRPAPAGLEGSVSPPAPSETAAAPPPAPSAREVNDLWRAEGAGALAPFVERLLAGRLGAQRDWNAAQVRLDNEILRWVEERFAATHAHYDGLLGALGRRLDEADERHRRLEQELVAHVRELVRRLDLVAVDANRGRSALELQLDDLRLRLARLERALDRRS